MTVGQGGLLLLGCGKMGGALLRGWLDGGQIGGGLAPDQITVLDPHPAEWVIELQGRGLRLNTPPETPPAIVVIATKPQIMATALPGIAAFGNGSTLFLSIAAGTLIATFEDMLGAQTPVVRAMPNTPAAIGAGSTAFVANAHVTPDQLTLAEQLLAAVGQTTLLEDEEQMHAVTALSGSGPAYVFAMTEALTRAGIEMGLSAEISSKLSVAMVAGSGALMRATGTHPAVLREQVTSPNGTTAAGLGEMMRPDAGIFDLMEQTIRAATRRSRELAAG